MIVPGTMNVGDIIMTLQNLTIIADPKSMIDMKFIANVPSTNFWSVSSFLAYETSYKSRCLGYSEQ